MSDSYWIFACLLVGVILLAGCTDYPNPDGRASGASAPGAVPPAPSNSSPSGAGVQPAPGDSGTDSPSGSPPAASAPSLSDLPAYTLADVAMHNSPDDCWVAVNSSVLNLSASPLIVRAGSNLTSLCGTDATSDLTSIFGPRNFSRNMSGDFSRFNRTGTGNGSSGWGNRTGAPSGQYPNGMRMIIGKLAG